MTTLNNKNISFWGIFISYIYPNFFLDVTITIMSVAYYFLEFILKIYRILQFVLHFIHKK